MCGIAGMFGRGWNRRQLDAMIGAQTHRGPDASGAHFCASGLACMGHNRLSIIDLSDAGRQPMRDATGRYWVTFNGEIYNYLELRSELQADYPFRTKSDTEVLLAAYAKWGEACLEKFIGMFAFVIWDERERRLFGARDRFGVKPLFLHEPAGGGLWISSEIKALHAAGVPQELDPATWAGYFASGLYEHDATCFWKHVRKLAPGGCFTWSAEQGVRERIWYDLAPVVWQQGMDQRDDRAVGDELLGLLEESVRLRFRADVPVGVCLSGGLDSSLLLGLVHRVQGADSAVKTFTFFCGDPRYDELPWVEQMLASTRHPACFCRLTAEEVPALAARVAAAQDEPFGGLPTLGMAKVHERAHAEGVTVLLDGNGLDEGWAGYDYYARAQSIDPTRGPVQGTKQAASAPAGLLPEFAGSISGFKAPMPFGDALRDLQYRDIRHAKIPRAMRFADRVSMLHSRELREPFLDHRILELGLRQPLERKIRGGVGKWLPRQIAASILPQGVREAPKRPVQTPQREWLREPLRDWADAMIESALRAFGGRWFDPAAVRQSWRDYRDAGGENSFFVWQWISLGLVLQSAGTPAATVRASDETMVRQSLRVANGAVAY